MNNNYDAVRDIFNMVNIEVPEFWKGDLEKEIKNKLEKINNK